jgi:hypothetical protein
MPAAKIDVELERLVCAETESTFTNDKIFIMVAQDVVPKNGGSSKDLTRLPSNSHWTFKDGDDTTLNQLLFHIDDFEGRVELVLEIYDQDTADTLPDKVIDAAVERTKQAMDEVALAAASTFVGVPVAGAILAAKPFADAVGAILKLTTFFDSSDLLGTMTIRINTDQGARKQTQRWLAKGDDAEYEAFINVTVEPY